ncbi:MAG: hypothetical protein ABH812_00720 [bacterium]
MTKPTKKKFLNLLNKAISPPHKATTQKQESHHFADYSEKLTH